jgi:ABC-2 type transport system permease protein
MRTLVPKLLRDVRLPLIMVGLLLGGYQILWVKITQRITGQLLPFFLGLAQAQKIKVSYIEDLLFKGPGQIVRTLIGGEHISLDRAMDMLSIGYIHPLIQTILCIWAVGRASGAMAGEIDRGTMELLLAQPIARTRVVLAHLAVDLVTIPLLCFSMWGGTWLGTRIVGPFQVDTQELAHLPFPTQIAPELLEVDAAAFGPALWNIAALLFAVSGCTIWLSAAGRFRWRVLGVAVFLTLLQFLINLLGQLWDVIAVLRPFTVFFYYQPQQIILQRHWTVDLGDAWNGGKPLLAVNVVAVLAVVGAIGYVMALWTFRRRDLPAPL